MSSPSSSGSAERPPAAPPQEDAQPPPEFDTSLFPAPPAFYHRYTDADLANLDPPNVDWITQDGSYTVFGETWPVEETTPTLKEMGVPEMFDPDSDRKLSLQSLLRTLILTYTQLLDALLTPPPSLAHPEPTLPTDPERLTEHMRLICINMHYLVNELRPVQARETLKAMMQSQIDLRRRKTAAIKRKCAGITAQLAALQTRTLEAANAQPPLKSHPRLDPSPAEAAATAAQETLDIFAKLRARAAAADAGV
ncbi:MED7-domain-containing protein [Rhodotorula sp. JG-1b]|nr:MED7-domain-containing protein [Rhodotorula sp. JG-1b]